MEITGKMQMVYTNPSCLCIFLPFPFVLKAIISLSDSNVLNDRVKETYSLFLNL